MVPQAWSEAGARFGEDGLLYLAEWRRGFDVHELRALFFQIQQIRALQLEVKNLTAQAEAAATAADRADDRALWYRRQLVLESRLGLALQRIDA